MHPELEPFAKDYAEKERAHQHAWRDLEASNRKFMAADPGAADYYELSRKHGLVFNAWSDANAALKSAARKMYAKAAELAQLPADHPLWKLTRE